MRAVPLISLVISLSLVGCHTNGDQFKRAIVPVDVQIVRYHVKKYYESLEEFTRRLYLKNPKYEEDLEAREKKIRGIFQLWKLPNTGFNEKSSHEVLEAAFETNPAYGDRVFLLSLGLTKSIKETYDIDDGLFFSSLTIPLERLKRLYHNISQVNWRLKVYRDEQGKLLFLTNEAGENGYINMGYETIMTEIMTRIEDDIFLRGGVPPKLIFDVSTFFLSIIL